jgi:hypothetical protein
MSSRRGMPESPYVKEKPNYSHHVEMFLYADDTAIISMSRMLTLLVGDVEPRYTTYLIASHTSG